jgi:hypothetical protein
MQKFVSGLLAVLLTAGCAVSPEVEPEESEAPPPLQPHEQTRKEAEALIGRLMEKNVTYGALRDPEDRYNLNIVKNVHIIAPVTGEYSINKTKTNYDVGGTDLGTMWSHDGKIYLAYGDTFRHEPQTDNWRSNVLAYTTDFDYTDGILFDGMILNNRGEAKELLRGKKIDNLEVTKIPTGGISIGGAMYLSFMSVKHWGEAGVWDCNFGQVAKSVDGGETWQYMDSLKWPGDSKFCQMAPVVDGDWVYVPGITGGRNGSAALMRVPVERYEDYEAYEYLTAVNDDGSPVFVKGQDGLANVCSLLPKPVGEMSFMYSEYLGEWLVTYIMGLDIIVRSAKDIWGPYSAPVKIAAQEDFPGLYGAFMHPSYVSEGGKKIGFMMSLWTPIYNSFIMEMELEK